MALLAALALGAPAADEMASVPGWSGPLPSKWYSGYVNVTASMGREMLVSCGSFIMLRLGRELRLQRVNLGRQRHRRQAGLVEECVLRRLGGQGKRGATLASIRQRRGRMSGGGAHQASCRLRRVDRGGSQPRLRRSLLLGLVCQCAPRFARVALVRRGKLLELCTRI